MFLNELTIKEAAEGLRSGKFTSVDLVRACLQRIKERNSEINAFITVCEESALLEAQKADRMIEKGEGNILTGIPFSVKDSIATAGIRSTAASKILDNYITPFDATVVGKIRKNGGVLIGKTNCDAFGHGASNENSMYGAVKNPYDLTKVSGGSSGGSAASVADNMCLYSIAEDTGGSIRQPASFCGVAGLRPTYGRNSRFGIMPMASSLDVVGPMAKNIQDLSLVQKELAGLDGKDATSSPDTVVDYVSFLNNDIKGKKVGVPKEYLGIEGIDEEVKNNVFEQIEKLRQMGAEIVPVSLPHTKYGIAVYYILVPSEDSSNMGRIDSIRYGVRDAQSKSLYDLYAFSRENGLSEEIKRRILIGTYVLSAGYYDAYYTKAQKVRTLIKQDFEKVFEDVDVLITPTSPFTAFALGEKQQDPLKMYLADIMLSASAVAGVPALSVFSGKNKIGLPFGVQFIGPRLKEEVVLNFAYKLENFK